MINTTPKRPVLRYHGGKWLLAKWIISHFPPHRVYVELFGGAGSVLLQKPRSYAEVYNDKWDTVVNVFQVLRNPDTAQELERLLRLTPFARTEFKASSVQAVLDPVEKARRTIFRSFSGFGSAATNGDYGTGFRANSNRSGTTPARDWVNYPDNIKAFTDRLMGVIIENKDYYSVMQQHDSPDTLFYVDPPYLHDTRYMKGKHHAYAHEMQNADHIKLAERLLAVEGMAIVSGYPSELYDSLYPGWHKVEREALADGAKKRTEVLWINPAAWQKFQGR